LQADPSLRAALTAQARERLTRVYNWPRLAAQLEAFYDRLL
jgi:glycosyltransferase involved in cell wall biosynthesis